MKNRPIRVRTVVQILFLVVITLIAINHTLAESGIEIPLIGSASLHAVCPFGGVVSIYQYVTAGTFVKKIHESAFILMFIVFALAIAFGPVFCGWICPFGTVQEFVSKIGRKIFKGRHNTFVPASIDRYLRYLRYVVLFMVVFVTARSVELLFSNIDPYYALFNFWSGDVALPALIALFIVLGASLFVERPFCKYTCPYGAVLGIFNLVRIFGIKRSVVTCIDCEACDKVCPMNIHVSTAKTLRHHQCISCLECTSEAACPVSKTVEQSAGFIKSGALLTGSIAVLIFIAGIGLTMAFNLWQTESSKVPARYLTGEFAGEYNPADIRGSYTFGDIEEAFGVPSSILAEAFALPPNESADAYQVKRLEESYGELPDGGEVGTDAVRLFTALYLGRPFAAGDTTRLPAPALELLRPKLAPADLDALRVISVDPADVPVVSESAKSTMETTGDLTVRGNTTFADLLSWGLTKEEIEAILERPMGPRTTTVRDYLKEQGMEFSVYKTALQELLSGK